MNAVNAGASVVTFATLAGTGLKELYQAVSAFRNGPRDVENLLKSIEELTGIVTQLSTVLNDPQMSLEPQFASELEKSLKSCEESTTCFKSKLKECEVKAASVTLQWMVARFRPVLYQSDFEKMRLCILHYLAVFTVQVGVLNGLRTAAVGNAVQCLDRRAGRAFDLQDHLIARSERFEARTLQVMNMHDTSLKSLEVGIQHLAPWLTERFEALNLRMEAKIDTLPDRVVKSWLQRQTAESTGRGTLQVPAGDDLAPEVHTTIKRLCALAMSKDDRRQRLDMQQSLIGLQALLRSMQHNLGRVGAEVQEVIRMTESAGSCVFLRPGSNRHTRLLRHNSGTGTTRLLQTPFGRAIFWSRRVDVGNDYLLSGFDAAITQFLNIDDVSLKLTLHSFKSVFAQSTTLAHPIVSISKVLPAESRIFRKIYQGDLDAVKRLVWSDECGLLDCDSQGRSILNHALYSGHPEIARFLITTGAGITGSECHVDGGNRGFGYAPPLAFWELPMSRSDATCEERSLEDYLRSAGPMFGRPSLTNPSSYMMDGVESFVSLWRAFLEVKKGVEAISAIYM